MAARQLLGGKLRGSSAERELAETRFGQERMLLYSIINAVTDPILLTDTEGKLIIANTHAEKLFAAPEDASEGLAPRGGAQQHAVLGGAVDERGRRRPSCRAGSCCSSIRSKDRTCCSSCSARAPKDERQGTYVVSILRNITDLARRSEEIEESYRTLRMAQAEVRDERHRLDLIIDSVADPILVTDPEGRHRPDERAGRAAVQRPGTAGEAAQRRVQRQRRELDRHLSSNVLTRTGEQRYRGEIQLPDPADGRAAAGRGVAGTILSEQGELMWVVTILHDLTEALEKARLYEQLKEASAELERKVQEATAELAAAERAAAAAAHRARAGVGAEVAVPRQHVARVPHAAQRDPGLHAHAAERRDRAGTDPQRKSLTRIDSNSRHLLALINDILDITRIEAGRMPLNLDDVRVPSWSTK